MNQGSSYGVTTQTTIRSEIDALIEELKINGFSILNNVMSEDELKVCRNKLDEIYKEQEDSFGVDKLRKIREENLVRCPLVHDEFFLKIATNPKVLEIVQRVIGDYFILHLQNGIINKPNEQHHQSSWHRDLPYQEFVISRPLAIGALFCIDEFTAESGSTMVLPFSHRLESLPSEEYVEKFGRQVLGKAGSVILFDSMLFHRAGYNSGNFVRRAINNVYVVPILKQQINLASALNGKYSDNEFLAKILGYNSNSPSNVTEWRNSRLNK